MRELCVPVFGLDENENAEILLKVSGKKIQYNFRIVSFKWDDDDDLSQANDEISISLARIARLSNAIKSYDKAWELIQIFNPSENAKFIQVLYRKKQKD
ncbi:MAG: hypothetical protein J7L04_01645 [Bacteroidales bacterium]|nr:hypothetical protein [Bacteroidales bacterium]